MPQTSSVLTPLRGAPVCTCPDSGWPVTASDARARKQRCLVSKARLQGAWHLAPSSHAGGSKVGTGDSLGWALPSGHPYWGLMNEAVFHPPDPPNGRLNITKRPQPMPPGTEQPHVWALPRFLTQEITRCNRNGDCLKPVSLGVAWYTT